MELKLLRATLLDFLLSIIQREIFVTEKSK